MMNTLNSHYAIFGNPVAHSRSPQIHAHFAESLGQTIVYERRLAPLDDFVGALALFRKEGGVGANVTLPFKEQAFALANHASARAAAAGAANFLFWKDDAWYADNTDGVGLVTDLKRNCNVTISGKRVLILGAGGASRGVIAPLLAEKPSALVIANRSVEKAQVLVRLFAKDAGDAALSAATLQEIDNQAFDIVINATSASIKGALPFAEGTQLFSSTGENVAYDMMYSKKDTVFMTWARGQGAAQCFDGLGMLVEQAAESYLMWRGVRPESAPVIKAIRAELLAG